MKLLFGTGNKFKYNLMKERLKELKEIEVITPIDLNINIEINEDGKTPAENAMKKAKAYYELTKLPTIAEDSGLYIDEFSEEDQPGLFVKRINGRDDLSDEEILNYYIQKLNLYGGKSLASYHTGVCLIDENGNIFSDTIEETKFLLTSKKFETKVDKGGILELISYDINANKYFGQRTKEEEKKHYEKLDNEYKKIHIKKIINML